MIKKLYKTNAYKASTFGKSLSVIKQLRAGTLRDQLILIEGVYVRVFFRENYDDVEPHNKKLIHPWTTNDFGDQDVCLTIYDDFFEVGKINTQLFLLAWAIGYYKLNDLWIPQYGVDKRRREALKQLDVIEEDIRADRYAADVVKLGAKDIMLDIAEYLDRVFENPKGALEWKLRSRYVK